MLQRWRRKLLENEGVGGGGRLVTNVASPTIDAKGMSPEVRALTALRLTSPPLVPGQLFMLFADVGRQCDPVTRAALLRGLVRACLPGDSRRALGELCRTLRVAARGRRAVAEAVDTAAAVARLYVAHVFCKPADAPELFDRYVAFARIALSSMVDHVDHIFGRPDAHDTASAAARRLDATLAHDPLPRDGRR